MEIQYNGRKTLEEEYIETTEVLASPGINLFNTSLPEIVRNLKEIPSDIAEQLGKWQDNIVGLVEEVKEAFKDMTEVKDLEKVKQEPLEEALTEEEMIVEEETASIQVQPEYGFFMDRQIYEISHGFIEKEELSYDKFQYEIVLTSSVITGSSGDHPNSGHLVTFRLPAIPGGVLSYKTTYPLENIAVGINFQSSVEDSEERGQLEFIDVETRDVIIFWEGDFW